jgi:hypothetical protein
MIPTVVTESVENETESNKIVMSSMMLEPYETSITDDIIINENSHFELKVEAWWEPPIGAQICIWIDPYSLPENSYVDSNPACGTDYACMMLYWDVGYCQSGEYTLEFMIGGSPGEASDSLVNHILVLNKNRYPEIAVTPPGPFDVYTGETIYMDVFGYDADWDECGDDGITLECDYSEYFHQFEEEPDHYYFEWTPTIEDVGTHYMTFSAYDWSNAIRNHEVMVKIRAGEQPPWNHSTLCLKDGSIRDDELAKLICDELWAHRNMTTNELNVKDVKIMCQQCYGGGMSDDFKKIFEHGKCAGIPWVFGSASNWDEVSYGYTDGLDCWTDALHPEIDGDTKVLDSFKEAKNNDPLGDVQGGVDVDGEHYEETPTYAHGNGGHNLKWNNDPDTKHVGVLFGGDLEARHKKDIDKMEEVLKNTWENDPKNKIFKDKGTADEGKESSLRNLIRRACENLTNKTQLVLFFTDHGDTHHNDSEFQQWTTKIIREAYRSLFRCHNGWSEGFNGMVTMDVTPAPYLSLGIMEPIQGSNWRITLNDHVLTMPSGTLYGEVEIPVDYTYINDDMNDLEIINLGSGEIKLNGLELSSGPVPTITLGNSPFKPDTPSGKLKGEAGQSYDYTTSTTDPELDDVCYGWDWNGDNTVDEWTGYHSSGDTVTTSHTWSNQGTYKVKVKAKDKVGNEGVWSDSLTVKMPKSKAAFSPFLRFLLQHSIINKILRVLGL